MRKNSLFINLSILFFVAICCSGFSFIQPFRIYMIGFFSIFLIFYNIKGHTIFISLKQDTIIMLLFILLMILGLRTSFNKIETLKYIYIYITGFLMLLMPLGDKFTSKVIKGIEVCTKVIAISIIINAIIPNLFRDYLPFLIADGSSRIATEINNHVYSGLMGEKAEAAYIMIIGLIVLLSNCVRNNKINGKDKIWLFIYLVALLLPAKRMLFAIGVLICVIFMLFWTKGKKKFAIILGFCILGIILLMIATKIPMLNTLISRFISYSNDSTGNGRIYLWEHAINMFYERKLFGYGYGSFNDYASAKGVILSASGTWISQAHNIYLQLLGEMGIIGFGLFSLLIINNIYTYLKLFIKRKNMSPEDLAYLFIGTSILILTLVYGYSGNCIYYTNQIMLLFFSMSICSLLRRKYIIKNGD